MNEMKVGPGEHVESAMKRLAAQAPSFCEFNGVRVEASPGESPAKLYERWNAGMEEQRRKYEASDEYKQEQLRRMKEIVQKNDAIRYAAENLECLDFGDMAAVLQWIDSIADATDDIGVDRDPLNGVADRFAEHGLVPNMNTGPDYKKDDRDNVAKYINGQALSFLTRPPYAIHGVWSSFYEKWKTRFGAA